MSKKRILSGILTAIISMAMASGVVSAEGADTKSVTEGSLKYRVIDSDADGFYDVAEVEGFIGDYDDRLVSIPSEVEGYPVKGIRASAFLNEKDILSVTLPDSVENIGYSAFMGCESLVSVDLPDNLIEIPVSCFSGCISLSGVKLPETVQTIGFSAFDHTAVSAVALPDSLLDLGGYAFTGCDSLTSIDFGDGSYAVGEGAFSYCHNLQSVNIPDNIVSFDKLTFSNCSGLKNIIISGLTSIPEKCFEACVSLQSVTLPEEVLSIKDGAFAGCTGLSTLKVLRSDCEFGSSITYGVSDLTIYGWSGSTAETFATENGYTFVAMDEEPTTTEPTEATSTPSTPEGTVDWSRVLYGDVNLDGGVSISDIVVLSKHNVSNSIYPLANETAEENADCLWDGVLDSGDVSVLIEYNIGVVDLKALGRDDKAGLPMYT